MLMRPLAALLALSGFALASCAPPRTTPEPQLPRLVLEVQASGTTALLQAVSAVDDRVAWVSGHRGTWLRTLDGGARWEVGSVPDADSLQFRDVHGVSADTAWLMSAGDGELSRVYRTVDGGRTWTLQLVNPDAPRGFYDCIAFWDGSGGLLYGDEVDGRLVLLETSDGGEHWTPIGSDRLPPAQRGEGGFAASGSCVIAMTALGIDRAWVGTGNGAAPRVLRSIDRGRTWQESAVPLPGGEASGITALTFRDAFTGVAVGGEIGRRDGRGDYVALSSDGGATWSPGGRPTFAGAVYGAAYVPHARVPVLIAVGPGGADVSYDDGRTWLRADSSAYWSVGAASPTAAWMVGPGGRIVKGRVDDRAR